ncbi:MAG TPA: hypothetical protein PLI18_01180 [Pirellulaceae bacterium]|nr:hypothetical protein [Pirellulaceae bacterium]
MSAVALHESESRSIDRRSPGRRGTALVVVMVVVVVLALAAYGFLYVMRTEYRNARFGMEADQARAAALSGVQATARWLELPDAVRLAEPTDSTADPSRRSPPFRAIPLELDLAASRAVASGNAEAVAEWSFSVVSGRAAGSDSGAASVASRSAEIASRPSDVALPAFGVTDESSKLDIRWLPIWERAEPGSALRALESIFGDDRAAIDAVLGSLDLDAALPNDSLSPNAVSPNRAPEVDETIADSPSAMTTSSLGAVVARDPQRMRRLIDSFGNTAWWGGDLDRNYRLDPWEAAPPRPTSLGSETRGETFGADRFGSASSPGSRAIESPGIVSDRSATSFRAPRDRLTAVAAERNERFDGTPRIRLDEADATRLADALRAVWTEDEIAYLLAYRTFGPAPSGSSSASTLPATDPSFATWSPSATRPLPVPIDDPLALVDSAVTLPPGTLGPEGVTIASPFRSDGPNLPEVVEKLLDQVTVDPGEVIEGRISLSEAPAEVLRAIPGWNAETVERIVEARSRPDSGGGTRRSIGWIWAEGLVDATTMARVRPYLTLGGDVASAQVIGFRDDASPTYRFDVLFDATSRPARVVSLKTWHAWGRGFSAAELRGETSDDPLSPTESRR